MLPSPCEVNITRVGMNEFREAEIHGTSEPE